MIQRRLEQLKSLVFGLLRIPFVQPQYEIKRGYIHRKDFYHFSAIGAKDQCQKEVYELAERIARENNFKTVVDVGCGSAYKLMHNFADRYQFTGIDIKKTYEHLSKTYPQYHWLNGEEIDYSQLSADLVICSDVIEHVLDPTELLNKIKSIKDVKFIVLSTPDRLLARGWFDYGPPKNYTHIREWNGKEFARYISSQGFHIQSHQISNYKDTTQLIICQPPKQPADLVDQSRSSVLHEH